MQIIFKACCLLADFQLKLTGVFSKESENNVKSGPVYALCLIFKILQEMNVQVYKTDNHAEVCILLKFTLSKQFKGT